MRPPQSPQTSQPAQPDLGSQDGSSWGLDVEALNAAALGLLAEEAPEASEPEYSAIFARNLEAIALRSPRVAKRIGEASARADVVFVDTGDGVPSAMLPTSAGTVALASKRRPLAEAATIASSIDLESHGGIVVLGFGLGYHAQAIAERVGLSGVVIVFEPDIALLRAVLERVDHSEWIRAGVVCFLTDEDASGEMSAATTGLEAPLSVGIELVEHAPSRARLGKKAGVFGATFAEVVTALRTQVITTLMQSDVTLRNLMMNAAAYIACPGIADLKGAAAGRAAVVVSAGPSLERNLHLLGDAAVRERVVVIAVQTVLRPMLDRGIRPDFVTALDYHEISTRFYEGLTREDLEGITLVAEPKVNPAVLDAFPGAIRLVRDDVLEQLFGPTRTEADRLTPGATVAHLAYYLARHLGCDPAILIGQDLGFTDGQYYSSGAAIHDVWAPELNPFRTLEMFEWERIARGKSKLIRRTDHLGRPIYTDQQMATYLAQFEREFSADVERGLTIVDATEGGVAKRGTTRAALADALTAHAGPGLAALDLPKARSAHDETPVSLRKTLESIRSDARSIARSSRKTQKLLRRVAALHEQPNSTEKINGLVRQIHTIRDDVTAREPAYGLVQRLNQTGTFQRFKADRLLKLNPALDEREIQKRQVERDALNVGWIAQMGDLLEELSDATLASLAGGTKQIRPRPVVEGTDRSGRRRGVRTLGVVTADTPERRAALKAALDRVAGISGLDCVAVLADDADAARAALDGSGHAKVEIVELTEDDIERAWQRRLARARAWAGSCWRGGLGGAGCYDEALRLEPTAALLDRMRCDAAMILDGAWSELDTELCGRIIERFAESPDDRPLVFSQAAPGRTGCVISRSGVDRLMDMRRRGTPFASIGGLLSYVPGAAASDPIAADSCVKVGPDLRDAPVARRLTDLTIELTGAPTNRRGGERRSWWAPVDPAEPMTEQALGRVLDEHADRKRPFALTISCRGGASVMGDPIRHPRFVEIMGALRGDPRVSFIHLRTDMAGEIGDRLLEAIASADVISIDLLAQTEAVYARISGNECTLQSVLDNAQRLNHLLLSERVEGALGACGPVERWIVPRITRCDSSYDQIEGFYDHWVSLLGHAVIDPLPRAIDGQRISALRIPRVAERRLSERLAVDAAGNRI